MLNEKELKIEMIRKEKTSEHLYKAIGISKSAWFRKMNGNSEFTQSEIAGLIRELELDDERTRAIFFDVKVS